MHRTEMRGTTPNRFNHYQYGNYTPKRIFIGLISAGLLTLGLLVVGFWYLTLNRTSTLHKVLWDLLALIFIGIFVVAAFGIGSMVLSIWSARVIVPLQGMMRIAMNMLFPIALWLARLLHIDLDRVKRSFVEVNNQLVRSKYLKVAPEKILLLSPHCLQNSDCPHKITMNVDNCRRCGKCLIKDLLDLRDRYGLKMGVATGGTLARKYVKECRPHAVVAVACERDLTSGILDAAPLPVLGVTNMRPNGPCLNTCVDLKLVEEAILYFTKRKEK